MQTETRLPLSRRQTVCKQETQTRKMAKCDPDLGPEICWIISNKSLPWPDDVDERTWPVISKVVPACQK